MKSLTTEVMLSFSDTPIVCPDDRDKILKELFDSIGSESTKVQGLEQLAFYIKQFKREIGSTDDFYLRRQNEVLNRIKQTPKSAMSTYVNKYATDIEDIVQHCAWYLYDSNCINQPNIDLLQFFINGLRVDRESGYDRSILQIRNILLRRMWKLVFFESQLPYPIQENLIDVYPEFFIEILSKKILDQICDSSFEESDLMLVKIDLNYQKILRLCQLYKNAFQMVYTTIAEKMIATKNTKVAQTFLTTFLNDVKSAMKVSEFPHHYEDELINYVLIFNECKLDDEDIVRHFANKLKETNYLHYFILVSHFPNFLRLLDQ